jgi:hypothetical protein
MKSISNSVLKLAVSFAILLIASQSLAQERVSISIHQDFKLGVLGDDKHGYKAGTINILARLKLQGDQQKHGYMIVFPEYEHADILGTYKRYSANVGYTFNKLVINSLEATATLGYGWIDRYGKSLFSFSGSGELAYKINDFKLSIIGQLTERKDLAYLYGKNEIRFSGFIGLEFNIFRK